MGGERVTRDPVHGRRRIPLRRREGVAERASLGQHLVRRVERERVGLDRIEGRHGLRARRVASTSPLPPLPPPPPLSSLFLFFPLSPPPPPPSPRLFSVVL